VLSMDGFQSQNTYSSSYSCWPASIMSYNLPANKCLKQGYLFLALVIPGLMEPKKQMNIFLCSLIEELKELWQGAYAYDSHMKCRFNLCPTYL
jgi:hypothetical protein